MTARGSVAVLLPVPDSRIGDEVVVVTPLAVVGDEDGAVALLCVPRIFSL